MGNKWDLVARLTRAAQEISHRPGSRAGKRSRLLELRSLTYRQTDPRTPPAYFHGKQFLEKAHMYTT